MAREITKGTHAVDVLMMMVIIMIKLPYFSFKRFLSTDITLSKVNKFVSAVVNVCLSRKLAFEIRFWCFFFFFFFFFVEMEVASARTFDTGEKYDATI